jgi:hypothetical protein
MRLPQVSFSWAMVEPPTAHRLFVVTLATNGVCAGKAVMYIWCNRLEQLIIVVVIDILKALSN